MPITRDSVQFVLDAANHLLECCSARNVPDYLDCFAVDATTVVTYRSPQSFESFGDWAKEINRLEAENTFVVMCLSANQRVQLLSWNVAIFRHDATIVEQDASGRQTICHERETIIFRLDGDRWLAVHKHISPRPAQGKAFDNSAPNLLDLLSTDD